MLRHHDMYWFIRTAVLLLVHLVNTGLVKHLVVGDHKFRFYCYIMNQMDKDTNKELRSRLLYFWMLRPYPDRLNYRKKSPKSTSDHRTWFTGPSVPSVSWLQTWLWQRKLCCKRQNKISCDWCVLKHCHHPRFKSNTFHNPREICNRYHLSLIQDISVALHSYVNRCITIHTGHQLNLY